MSDNIDATTPQINTAQLLGQVVAGLICLPLTLILLLLLFWNMFEHGQPLADLSIIELGFLAALAILGKSYIGACSQAGIGALQSLYRLTVRLGASAVLAVPVLLMCMTGRDFPFIDLIPLALVLLAIFLARPSTVEADA